MSTRSIVALMALLGTACVGTASAQAAPADERAAQPAKVKIAPSQKQALRKGVLKVRVRGLERSKTRLKAFSSTFDFPRPGQLTKSARVRPNRRGRARAKLKLTKNGREDIAECAARTIQIRGKRVEGRVKLRRDTTRCAPKTVDLSRADTCNFIGQQEGSMCMLPFPDDYYTVADPTSATGRRVAFTNAGMPQNAAGTPIAAAPYNRNDGFSPGQTIVLRVPGLDNPAALAQTDAPPINHLGNNYINDPPVVVIDASTGERHPIWVEIDSNASTPERTALLIHPAVNFESGHRYVVGLRDLRRADGSIIPAPEGFRLYRDDLPSKEPAINAQRKRFESIFETLRDASVKRSDLYLAWDFTVATDENIAARMLHIRDDAFAELGDTNLADMQVAPGSGAPGFAVTDVDNFTTAENPNIARRIRGTFEVPCYLTPSCAPGGTFDLDADGLPHRTGIWTANFDCAIPHAAIDDPDAEPARSMVYGHGLLGGAGQVGGQMSTTGQPHNFAICGTDAIGMSSSDVPNIAGNILPNLANFPQLADRLQQGLLNHLYLGRLLIHPDGFISDAAFHVDDADVNSQPAIDTDHVFYNGNSQGGILGGAITAIGVDWDRGALGVPAMNYSVLLNRSIDFDAYKLILDPSYPDPMRQQLALSLIQMLWDRGEANGYAHRMTDRPLPNTPAHKVLMNVAFGDHQVTNFQADVEARTIGAATHYPTLDAGRWPDVDALWGIPTIPAYPYDGSAIFYGDIGPIRPNPDNPTETIGVAPPPLENVPNRAGEDPHGAPRGAPAAFQLVSDFLRPNGLITNPCGPDPCYAGGWTGP